MPEDSLKAEQKALNNKRKYHKKIRAIETRMEENDKKLENWMEEQRIIIKTDEKARYADEQASLRQQLDNLANGTPEDMDAEEETLDEVLATGPSVEQQKMEERMMIAEKSAMDAPQAMLQLQSQMQQMFAYQMYVNGPMPTHPTTEPMMPTQAEQPPPKSLLPSGHGGMPGHRVNSHSSQKEKYNSKPSPRIPWTVEKGEEMPKIMEKAGTNRTNPRMQKLSTSRRKTQPRRSRLQDDTANL